MVGVGVWLLWLKMLECRLVWLRIICDWVIVLVKVVLVLGRVVICVCLFGLRLEKSVSSVLGDS